MEKVTLYIGLNDKITKKQKIDTQEAIKISSNILAMYTGGATIYNATGIYKHDNGAIVIENTLRIEIINVHADRIKKAVTILKNVLNQESIIMQYEIVKTVEV